MLDPEKSLPPPLDVENLTAFAYLVFSALDPDDELHDVVVAKGAYALKPADDRSLGLSLDLEPAPESSAIAVVDEPYGALNKSSVRIESDLAPFKPMCDTIVIGSAHSPDGKPVESITVGIDIDDDAGHRKLSHRLVVSGPRDLLKRTGFERGVTSLARSLGAEAPEWFVGKPTTFVEAPLRYETAFGGELKVGDDEEAAERLENAHRLSDEVRAKHPDGAGAPVAHAVCRMNPLGCGFVEGWHARATRATRYPAPRIEAVGASLTPELIQALVDGRAACGSHPALTPQGFGVIAKAWQPRLKLAGTVDKAWRATRAPLMPKDFDMAFWNCASPTMQCAHLKGGETVTLTNLSAAGSPGSRREGSATIATFRVPSVDLALRMKFDDERVVNALLPIDTLVVDLEASLVHIAWRIRIPSGVPLLNASLLSLAELRKIIREQTIAAE